MNTLTHFSRAFVEFGPFTKEEVLDFHRRGMMKETDYLRDDGTKEWLHYEEWLTGSPTPTVAAKKPRAAKKAAKSAAPVVKKAAKKKE
ncbi:MAG: hypothetical protein IPK32_25500 [Verrucomicrobiaceae bacterium]|nr:hypothetical protein [Verrucomicrobiaceae bacterium]